jgi:hypothetical protein
MAREMHAQEREIHVRAREIHVQARADHVAARGGWNRAVKALTGSWDNGEDPARARQSYGGTKVYRSGLEKTEAKHHCRTENGATAGGGKGQRRLTRQGGVDPRRLNNETRAQGKKKRKKGETTTKRG